MKKSIYTHLFLGIFLTSTRATTFLYNWESTDGGGIYNGYIKEEGTLIGKEFSPSEVTSFMFGSPNLSYSMADSFLGSASRGIGFGDNTGIVIPTIPVKVLTSELGGSIILEIQGTQETISGQSDIISGTWTETNLDATVPDITNSLLLLLTAAGALGIYYAISRRGLAKA
jgi:hypothetical protein